MSRRGPRFSEKEKLAIVKHGKKTGVKAVCARYGISTQSYRLWRYKINGIKPRKIAIDLRAYEIQHHRRLGCSPRQSLSEQDPKKY